MKIRCSLAPAQLAALALRDWAGSGGKLGSLSLGGDVFGELASALRERGSS